MKKKYKVELIIDKPLRANSLLFLEKVKVKKIEQVEQSSLVTCIVEAESLTEAVLLATKTIEAKKKGQVVGLAKSDIVHLSEAARRLGISRQAVHERRKQTGSIPVAMSSKTVLFSYSDWLKKSPPTWRTQSTAVDEAKEVEELNLWFRNRMRDESISMTIDRLESLYSSI